MQYNGKVKPKFEFDYNGDNIKFVREFKSNILYVNNIEVGRDSKMFAIPFISINRVYGTYNSNRGGQKTITLEWLQAPLTVYKFIVNGTVIKEYKGTN